MGGEVNDFDEQTDRVLPDGRVWMDRRAARWIVSTQVHRS
jgi:hypothetical protein